MSEPKFTPGPWRYGRSLEHGLCVFNTPQVGSPEHIIAFRDLAGSSVPNARLVAAAPDMYAVLRRFNHAAESGDLDRHDWKALDEALAKAEGRSV